MGERVHFAQRRHLRAGSGNLNDAAGCVHVFDARIHGFFGMIHFREAIEPSVRHADYAHTRFRPARTRRASVRPRQNFKERRLPGLRQPDNPDFQHEATLRCSAGL